MNKRLGLIAAIGLTVLSICGCQKESDEGISVVTEQPVLGVDERGYAGFTYLSAYTLSGDGNGDIVLYLPADENAYVGGTSIISKAEGVEVTLNYNPMLSEDIVGKPVKQRLQYMLDSEYSEIYVKNFENLEISDVRSIGDNAAGAEVSYLVYDDGKKDFTANWLEYYFVELEDGRVFKVVVKVNSDAETEQTEAVIGELEKYFEIDLSYEKGFLQAKIDGYEPDADDLAKMNGTTVALGELNVFLPEGWVENNSADTMLNALVSKTEMLNQVAFYTKSDSALDITETIMLVDMDSDQSSGQFGALDKGQEKMLEKYLLEEIENNYGYTVSDVTIIGSTDLGYVLQMDIQQRNEFNGYMYYIFKGYKVYTIGGVINVNESEEAYEALKEIIDQIYSTMEVQ